MTQISRRKFLGKSTLAAGLAPLAVSGITSAFVRSARAAEPGANDKVRLGLIGCGGMGQGDLQCFFLNPEVDCAVVCDVDDARIAKGVEICEKKRGKKPDTTKDFHRESWMSISTTDFLFVMAGILSGWRLAGQRPDEVPLAELLRVVEAPGLRLGQGLEPFGGE